MQFGHCDGARKASLENPYGNPDRNLVVVLVVTLIGSNGSPARTQTGLPSYPEQNPDGDPYINRMVSLVATSWQPLQYWL